MFGCTYTIFCEINCCYATTILFGNLGLTATERNFIRIYYFHFFYSVRFCFAAITRWLYYRGGNYMYVEFKCKQIERKNETTEAF